MEVRGEEKMRGEGEEIEVEKKGNTLSISNNCKFQNNCKKTLIL